MSGSPGEERGGRPTFPPEPPGEAEWPDGSEPDEHAAGSQDEEDDASLGTPFFVSDPKCWESGALKPGALIEFEIEDQNGPDGGRRTGLVLVFVKAVEMGDHGCWATVRILGGSLDWCTEWGIKTFSREKKRLHICRFGPKHCGVADARRHHIGALFTIAPAVPPLA